MIKVNKKTIFALGEVATRNQIQQPTSPFIGMAGVRYAIRSLWLMKTLMIMAGVSTAYTVSAVTLTAVVEGGRSGIVGATAPVTSTLSKALGDGRHAGQYGMAAISTYSVSCQTRLSSDVSIEGSDGKPYGIIMKNALGNDSGARLLPDGTATWQRTLADGKVLKGSIVYTEGLWTNTWSDGTTTQSSGSYADGTSPYSPTSIFCPNIPNVNYDPNAIRRSSVNVRFKIYAARPLIPGDYTVDPLYHADFSYSYGGDITALLVDRVTVRVANYSCALNIPTSVNLSIGTGAGAGNDTATLNYRVQCSDWGTSDISIRPYVSVMAAGVSSGLSNTPSKLGVAGTDGRLWIIGNWSGTAPASSSCSAGSTMYFDGRDATALSRVMPGGSIDVSGKVSFRLCGTGVPGDYAAQATFSVVQR
ncbi:hypothetical protein [Serratia microhaemolytica]|uniref:hypothetical protein n=1 Tax=Serratia microhaemolytica TaxID=2675110 RepID=UPI000FDEF617|nr:hypothetical protein [Serratia microhaemolytica]